MRVEIIICQGSKFYLRCGTQNANLQNSVVDVADLYNYG